MTLGTVAEHPTETAIRKVAEAFLLKLNSEAPLAVIPRFEAVIDRFAEVEGLPVGQGQSGCCRAVAQAFGFGPEDAIAYSESHAISARTRSVLFE
jgi:hypothetical protein